LVILITFFGNIVFSLKILKKLNKYTDVLQIKSKPHLTLLPEGRIIKIFGKSRVVGSRPEKKMYFLFELGRYSSQKINLEK
jgi:hypothetical protein